MQQTLTLWAGLAVANESAFTFAALPPEVWNQINGYMLEEPEPIRIALTRARALARRSHSAGERVRKAYRNRVLNEITGKWVPAIPVMSAILSTNHQIHDEAIQFLYGRNCFIFHRISDIKNIVSGLGDRAQLLRHVRVDLHGFTPKGKAKSAFDSLLRSKNLRSFEICHADICAEYLFRQKLVTTPSERLALTVKASKKLLQALNLSYQQQNISASALDVLKLRSDMGGEKNVRGTCKCAEVERANAKLQRELRSLVAAALNIQDK